MFQGVLAAGMGTCSDALISPVCEPSAAFLSGTGLLTAALPSRSYFLILIYLLCYFKAICGSEKSLCKMEGGAIFFSLKGGASLRDEKKA